MQEKKKVLFLAHWYPSQDRPATGLFLQKHASAINSIADVTVVSIDILNGKSSYDFKHSFAEENGVKTLRIVLYSRFFKWFYYALGFQQKMVRKTLKHHGMQLEDFDLLHSNVIFPSGLLGYKLAKRAAIPLIHTEHWSKFNAFVSKGFYGKLSRKTINYASVITPVSPFFSKQMEKVVPSGKLVVVPNVVDNSLFNYVPKQNRAEVLNFLCVASWNKPKNPFYFLNALESLYSEKKIGNFELNVVGEGKMLTTIKNRNYSFPIHFHGNKTPQELREFYANADYFLHGSDFETFSIVMLEALATGTPVLVSDVGVASEVINIENGFICENNPDDWKHKIELACQTSYKHEEIARKVSGMYSLEVVAEKFAAVYRIVFGE